MAIRVAINHKTTYSFDRLISLIRKNIQPVAQEKIEKKYTREDAGIFTKELAK